ncbi:cytochrome b [Paraburkholderia sp. UYCP14C]|uniref:cytochrome b n=1 Tax=Paraburkholderia sp. UYCP14C TaxID=2511130 RepID=UPI00102050E3|nr:cytochrome b/b6 domain-containing protein [Paraburkholderia sp. UYCP14C]RZF31242.1 cytochrome b [Paraburkholderia sp. UYCP14C]
MKHIYRYPFSISMLHWLLAVALIGNLIIGWMLDDNEDLLALHKSIGIVVLGLALVRVLNRLRMRNLLPPSTNAAGTPAYLAEKVVHYSLYVLMLAIPLLGWLKTNAAGHVASCFGLFSLPTLVSKSHELSHWLGQLHSLTAYGLAVLVGLHLLGALAHRLLKSENILPRILPLPTRVLQHRRVARDRD